MAALEKLPCEELASKLEFRRAQDDIRSYEEGTTEPASRPSPFTNQAYNDYAKAENELGNARHRKKDALLRKYSLKVVKELEVKLSGNENDPIAYQEVVPGLTVAGYMESFSLFDVNKVELHGTLRGLEDGNKPLTAKVDCDWETARVQHGI